ncbi:hypothetical protein ACU4GD_44720 [Cupriavidus basilensis]
MSPASTERAPGAAFADIAIVGAGPVGLALACSAAAQEPVAPDADRRRHPGARGARPARHCAVLRQPPVAGADRRLAPGGHADRQAYPRVATRALWPRQAAPRRLRCSRARLRGARYGDLCESLERALGQAIHAAPAPTASAWRESTTRASIAWSSAPWQAGADRIADESGGLVHLSGHTHDRQPVVFNARLAVQAEGGLFHQQSTRGVQGQKYRRDYGQTAIVAHHGVLAPAAGLGLGALHRGRAAGPAATRGARHARLRPWSGAVRRSRRRTAWHCPKPSSSPSWSEAFGPRAGPLHRHRQAARLPARAECRTSHRAGPHRRGRQCGADTPSRRPARASTWACATPLPWLAPCAPAADRRPCWRLRRSKSGIAPSP